MILSCTPAAAGIAEVEADRRNTPPHPASIANLLLCAARYHPHSGIGILSAHQDDATLLTYPELLHEAQRILGGLQIMDAAPGRNVVLLLEQPRDFIPAFWACVLGGLVPCLISPIRNDQGRWFKHLAHIAMLLDEPIFVTRRSLQQTLRGEINFLDLDSLRTGPATQTVFAAKSEDSAVLVLTSGSTGNSKAVVLTHGNITASIAAKNEKQRLTETDVTLNWISFDHIAALSEAHLLPLYAGAKQLHIDSAPIVADPLLFLRVLHRHRVSMTFTPNFLFGQINAALAMANDKGGDDLQLDLSCVRHIVSGGEAIVVDTGRKFLGLLKRFGLAPTALWPAFGMTETCAGCVYSRKFPAVDADKEFASLGLPLAGLQMRIVDEQGELAGPADSGELQLRGPMVFTRYFNNDEATRAAFTVDGWFRTGDLGRIEGGRLNLAGRSKDSIIVSGVNYFSHELETALGQLDGIEPAYIAAFPTRSKGADTEQLVIAFATSFALDDEVRLHQLTIAVRNTAITLWGFRPALILPLPKHAFVKTSLGKIQRALMRQRLEGGAFSAHEAHIKAVVGRQLGGYTPPAGPMETALAEIYAQIFELDPRTVSATASFFDLGGTSLDILKLKQLVEQRLGAVDVPVAKLLLNPTVRALARQDDDAYDPIVPLQSTGSKTPLFCVHPGIGEVLVFVNLAKYFVGKRPFYALRARGFNANDTAFASFDEMVDTYVAAIRRRQPQGPYALSGYSYGGVVAFEIAKRLEAQGEAVPFVGSIDMPPYIKQAMESVDFVESAVLLAFFLSLIDRQQVDDLPSALRKMQRSQACAHLVTLASPERLAELSLDLAKFTHWADLTHNMAVIGRTYVPSGTVESVVAFHANPLRGTKQQWLSDIQRWDEFTRRPTRYIEVPGEHYTLMGKHVASFQAVLCSELERTLEGR